MAASQIRLLFLALLALSASTSAEPTIHEILQQYGFPPGLLPDSVESFHSLLSPLLYVTYAVKLKSPCHVKYGSYDVYFDSDITLAFIFSGGTVSVPNGIKLDGQSVTSISAVGDSLLLANPSGSVIFLDVKLFETIPTCEVAAGKRSWKRIRQLPVTAAA